MKINLNWICYFFISKLIYWILLKINAVISGWWAARYPPVKLVSFRWLEWLFQELSRKFPDSCLVRENVKAYVARSDNVDAVGERWRTLPAGELLVLVGEVTAPALPYSNRSSSSANRQVPFTIRIYYFFNVITWGLLCWLNWMPCLLVWACFCLCCKALKLAESPWFALGATAVRPPQIPPLSRTFYYASSDLINII